MTVFVIVCAAMLVAAVAWTAWPILRPAGDVDVSRTRTERRIVVATLAIALPAMAGLLYAKLSNWQWNDPKIEQEMQISAEIGALQAALRKDPRDLEGWTLLGRTYVGMGQFQSAIGAYENAYRLTNGNDADVTSSLAEAIALADENALAGRAGELFEQVLARQSNHPKALFYSSIAAMRAGKLALARDRLKMLLAQNPPAQIRPMLERQIQDLDEQIAGGGAQANATPAAPTSGRIVKVAVKLAPALQQTIREPLTLFILARDPAAGGPPLAVERHGAGDLPLTVELSEADAMLPTRTIAAVPAVQIVARLSRSGTPQQQSGDYYGEANVQFDAKAAQQAYSVEIVIDRKVP